MDSKGNRAESVRNPVGNIEDSAVFPSCAGVPPVPAPSSEGSSAVGLRHPSLDAKRLSEIGQSSTGNEQLVCGRCQPLEQVVADYEQTVIRLTDRIAQLEDELAGREGQLRSEGAKLVALKRELARVQDEEPGADEVKHLLGVWMRCTGRDGRKKGRKPDLSVSGKRGQLVRKALRLRNVATGKHYTIGDLEQAFEGLGLKPYVGPFAGGKGRKPSGSPAERYDEVEHALRDEPTIDRFIAIAQAADAAVERDLDRVHALWSQTAAQEALLASRVFAEIAKREKRQQDSEIADVFASGELEAA